MKQLLKDNKGYFTVEASFIVPIVLFCVFGVMFAALYLYDLGTAKSLLSEVAVQVSDVIKTDAQNESGEFKSKELMERSGTYLLKSSYPKRAAEGKKRLKEELQKKLMISRIEKITLTAGQQKVTGKLRISFQIPFPGISQMAGALWKNNLTITVDNGSNAEQMRRWSSFE